MDVPDLVRERLGDEEVTAGVSIGDEDALCLTPTRTLVYRSEGILSDEHVEEFPHDVERLSVKEGRRKTKFAIEYVEGTETFTVPSDRGEKVLELLLQGVLRQDGVLDRRESIAGVYRFTELTLVITDSRVLKHIGNVVWDDDFENYPFERLTGLEFERASNATSIAIEIDGRPKRVKVPNETARILRQTLEEAVFGYYGVDSLEALNAAVGTREPEPDAGSEAAGSSDDIGFESGIDPLVTQGDETGEPPDGPERGTDRVEDSAVPSRMDVSPGSSEDDGSDSRAGGDGEAGAASDPTDVSERASGSAGAGRETDHDQSDTSRESRAGAEDERSRRGTGHGSESGSGDELDRGTDAHSGSDSGGAGSVPGSDRGSDARSDPDAGRDSGSGSQAGERDGSDRPGTAPSGGGERTGTGGDRGTPDAGEDAGTGAGDGTTGDRGRGSVDHPGGAIPPSETLGYEPASSEELAAVATQVEELADAVERQNELLKRQHKALKELVAEMRSE